MKTNGTRLGKTASRLEQPKATLAWKPSSDQLVNEKEQQKEHQSKLDYRKILDQQVQEKQMRKAEEDRLLRMEDELEALRLSKDRMKKELEDKEAEEKLKAKREQQEKILLSVSPAPPTGGRKQKTNNERSGGLGNGGGSSTMIILQPGDSGIKNKKGMKSNPSNRSFVSHSKYNPLSKKDLLDFSSRIESEEIELTNRSNQQPYGEPESSRVVIPLPMSSSIVFIDAVRVRKTPRGASGEHEAIPGAAF